MAVGRVAVIGVVVAAAGLAACGAEPASRGAVSVARVEVATPMPFLSVTAATDDALVGLGADSADPGAVARVYTSRDGTEWEPVELPGATADVALSQPVRAGRRVVVTGRKRALPVVYTQCCGSQHPPDAAFVWTSADGRRWDGGQIVASTPAPDVSVTAAGDTILVPINVGDRRLVIFSGSGAGRWNEGPVAGYDAQPHSAPWLDPDLTRVVDGEIVTVVSTGPGLDELEQRELVSSDDGRTWRMRPCAEARRCSPYFREGPGILTDLDEVSTDGGRTWHPYRVEPRLPEHERDSFRLGPIVRVPGGWLADGHAHPEGDSDYGYLVRSTDGITWERQIPGDPCDATTDPSSSFSAPVRAGDGWVSLFQCVGTDDTDRAAVYAGDPDGRGWRVAHTTRPEEHLGEPIAFRGRVYIPVTAPTRSVDHLTELLVVG